MGRILGVKKADNRRMEELREEGGVKENFTRKLVRGRVKVSWNEKWQWNG